MIEEIYEQITEILLNREDKREFMKISKIYPFTTENISGYLSKVKVTNKSVLTVAGSGDHILNLFLCKPSKITAFDINLLAYYFTNLKIAALKCLNYDDFINFFSGNTKASFCYKTFLKIKSYLNDDTVDFFNYLYTLFENDGCRVRNSNLFYQKPNVDHRIRTYNLYLKNEQNYAKTKAASLNYHWYHCSIIDVVHSLPRNKKYDVILLSNIMDYANRMFTGIDYNEKYISRIIYPLCNRLNSYGCIVAHCIFDIESRNDLNVLLDKVLWKESLHDQCIKLEEISYEGAIEGKKDMSLIIKKSA